MFSGYSILTDQTEQLAVKEQQANKLPRETLSYTNRDDRFMLKKSDFDNQYFSLYCQRLNILKPIVATEANKLWNKMRDTELPVLDRILDVEPNQSCIIIGTLIKQMKLLPSVLQLYTKERSIVPVPPNKNFTSNEDVVLLEDEAGRIPLIPASDNKETDRWEEIGINVQKYAHGNIVAIKGYEKGGSFYVEDICSAGAPPQTRGPSVDVKGTNYEGRYVALISGLAGANDLSKQLLFNYIEGHIGNQFEQNKLIRRIVRVFIAGNTVPEKKVEVSETYITTRKKNESQSQYKEEYMTILRELDVDIANLCSLVPVDILPGKLDPTNYTLPHQPLSWCLFPLASQLSTFNRVTAPHLCTLDKTTILGTTGEEVDNIAQFVQIEDKLELVENILNFRHLAPTAPDTLPIYPLGDADPFILDECPHVYFFGNQKSYASKLFQGQEGQFTQIIQVPSFAETSTIVLLNIDTLVCFPVKFTAFV